MAKAQQAANTYGLPRDVDPHDALLEEIARTAGHVDFLAGVIRSMSPGALVWGVTGGSATVEKGVKADKVTDSTATVLTEGAGINTWLTLYHQERVHLVNVCKTAIGCGIEERRVRIAEQQGAMLASVIQAILGDLGVATDPRVPEIVGRRLREVAA
jgi:hypothetical protein